MDWIHAFCISGVDEQFYHCATWEDLTNGIDDLIYQNRNKAAENIYTDAEGKEDRDELKTEIEVYTLLI